jgi:hypothetical protein
MIFALSIGVRRRIDGVDWLVYGAFFGLYLVWWVVK